MKGFIHSFESFGTKDGPGIRFVFFMQGCPLRCLYCHNPDTWKINNFAFEKTAEEAFQEVSKVKNFIRSGGVTVSGGEPLLQTEFVLELFKRCKEAGIHTAVDTSGYLLNEKIKSVLDYTDLVLLDIKHINPEKYLKLTGKPLTPTLHFVDYLMETNIPTWIRYVLVPGYSDDEADLHAWANYVSSLSNVKRVDILPFHQMGRQKWKRLGINYALKTINPPTSESIRLAESIFRQYHLPLG
ncbi:MAG: pyruvate formate-lyase-activating protein [Massilibacteroides sp.]|nr:pyruvate formate-lyase-activating protein [Massilibacteroides sp.]MDD3064222.1 pyruvate formate-lyase-activating protein [Massilibacteroides sp.]MDD4114581.1 pyruvate formate-lyase-activating protein [Massilibacteroides sp.]MDD4660779.1 pyruvate formate-lyase-activating protein [Massilibacteroides sp.]